MAMAFLQNGVGHLARRLNVVKTDRHIQARRDAVHHLNHRNACGFDHAQAGGGVGALGEDQAVDIPAKQGAQLQLFLFGAVAKVPEQRLIACGVGHRFNAAQHVGKHLVGQ